MLRAGLPDGGTSWHWRALPRALAAELLMCGDLVEAERLHALGLVNRLADTGQRCRQPSIWPTRCMAAHPTLASCKELLDEAAHQPLSAQLDLERAHFLRNLTHANAGEGIAAFLDKRTPHWR
jgi:enoyl-CoA hydratase/carnithine racemase